MVELARTHRGVNGLIGRALNQAARELLLAQSSDWAFIMKTSTMVEYAVKKTNDHIARFDKICDDVKRGTIDRCWLNEAEEMNNIFPDINYEVFC